jgi:DNA repair photolyase
MIISASRRTDIPAFHAEWFMNRLRAGYFYRVNPFNPQQVTGFSLNPEHVDAVCFWTKNPRPLMRHLDELNSRGLRYYFQFTLNPYNEIFEPKMPPLDERIATFIELAERIGPERVVWRYDPIILTSVTPVEWHLDLAETLAGRLKNATRRLMFSFCDVYGKGQGRLRKSLAGTGISFKDITAGQHEEALALVAIGFKTIAEHNAMGIFTCSEKADLTAFGIKHGACIDGNLLRELFAVNVSSVKDRNQRTACGCVESADMGGYNTCGFGCTYCYANYSEALLDGNRRNFYPHSPALSRHYEGEIEIRTSLHTQKKSAGCRQVP